MKSLREPLRRTTSELAPHRGLVALETLSSFVRRGGPNWDEYGVVNQTLKILEETGCEALTIRRLLRSVLESPNCMQGFGFLKPHGYSGDYEMIDRIYTGWLSTSRSLKKWDEYFHAQPAPRAVRNRKAYLLNLLEQRQKEYSAGYQLSVLNLGSGPMRDVFEYLTNGGSAVFDCIDSDTKALNFGRSLCEKHLSQVRLYQRNVIRFRPPRSYDLIWSGGLFDYFDDRLFRIVFSRLLGALNADGEIVVGNFSKTNPSKYWMEVVGDWHLHHRSADDLRRLALACGCSVDEVRIESEPESVNLFLRVKPTAVKPTLPDVECFTQCQR